MGTWLRLQKLSAVAAGAAGGVAFYLFSPLTEKDKYVYNSLKSNSQLSSCGKWDYNWDHREPAGLVMPIAANASHEEQNRYNEKLDAARSKVTRHIILVRHGEYHDRGETDADKVLTEVGRRQARYTGERLRSMKIHWDKMVVSTQTRAQETGKIIAAALEPVPFENDPMIREGAPIPPEPSVSHWKPEPSQFFRDGARIEAAFRKYFYRAEPTQEKSSYTLLVGHGNVIRYFTCRALQFPPEAWLRISLNHGSITWISILPSGRVTLRSLGDSGHIPPELITHK